jgi:hypothetical protein
MSSRLEGGAEELPAAAQGVSLDGFRDLAARGGLGELVQFGAEESGLLEGGELCFSPALERESQPWEGPSRATARPFPRRLPESGGRPGRRAR